MTKLRDLEKSMKTGSARRVKRSQKTARHFRRKITERSEHMQEHNRQKMFWADHDWEQAA